MTVTDVALGALLIGICGAAVTALVIFARWIESRAHASADVERFADAITAENADVLAQEAAAYSDARDALSDEMCDLLDEAVADVDALFEAAELVDELEGLQALLEDMGAHVNRVDRQAAA